MNNRVASMILIYKFLSLVHTKNQPQKFNLRYLITIHSTKPATNPVYVRTAFELSYSAVKTQKIVIGGLIYYNAYKYLGGN